MVDHWGEVSWAIEHHRVESLKRQFWWSNQSPWSNYGQTNHPGATMEGFKRLLGHFWHEIRVMTQSVQTNKTSTPTPPRSTGTLEAYPQNPLWKWWYLRTAKGATAFNALPVVMFLSKLSHISCPPNQRSAKKFTQPIKQFQKKRRVPDSFQECFKSIPSPDKLKEIQKVWKSIF